MDWRSLTRRWPSRTATTQGDRSSVGVNHGRRPGVTVGGQSAGSRRFGGLPGRVKPHSEVRQIPHRGGGSRLAGGATSGWQPGSRQKASVWVWLLARRHRHEPFCDKD